MLSIRAEQSDTSLIGLLLDGWQYGATRLKDGAYRYRHYQKIWAYPESIHPYFSALRTAVAIDTLGMIINIVALVGSHRDEEDDIAFAISSLGASFGVDVCVLLQFLPFLLDCISVQNGRLSKAVLQSAYILDRVGSQLMILLESCLKNGNLAKCPIGRLLGIKLALFTIKLAVALKIEASCC